MLLEQEMRANPPCRRSRRAGRMLAAVLLSAAAHLRVLQSLKAATGTYYAGAEFRDHDGLRQIESSGDTRIAVFRNARDGKTGIVLANLADEPAQVAFALEQAASNGQGRLYRPADLSGVTVPLSGRIETELQPFEVAVLCLEDRQ